MKLAYGADQIDIFTLSDFDNGNFLRPFSSSTAVSKNQKLIDQENSTIPDWTTEDFYKNLKFMVFKVKQRAVKNYGNYKSRQKLAMLKNTLDQIKGLIEADYDNSIFESLTRDEIYGYNWPYDNFSLIEAIKADIKIKM